MLSLCMHHANALLCTDAYMVVVVSMKVTSVIVSMKVTSAIV